MTRQSKFAKHYAFYPSDMEIRLISDQQSWDAFVSHQPWASFLQSWAWGEFQQTQGHEVCRFFVLDPEPVLACQLIRYNRRFGQCYWFAPRGPVIQPEAKGRARELIAFLLNDLSQRGRLAGHPLFIRLEPMLLGQEGEGAMPLRCRRTHSMSPAATIRIDVQQEEEVLLAAMHPKTRYNIRVAQRHGVQIREGQGAKDLEAFLFLTKETAVRDQIQPHSDAYLRDTYQFLHERGMARLRLAEHQGQVLVANMEMAYGDTLTYLHGASSSQSRQVMAPVLLQWEAMRTAKQEGYRWYDLYGANPQLKSNYYYKPSWEGITRFKQGFGGEQQELIGTWDLPLRWMLYTIAFPETFLRKG